jgi:hypothetical protein
MWFGHVAVGNGIIVGRWNRRVRARRTDGRSIGGWIGRQRWTRLGCHGSSGVESRDASGQKKAKNAPWLTGLGKLANGWFMCLQG